MAEREELAQNDGRARESKMLDMVITEWTSKQSIDNVLAVLEQAEVPSGRVYSVADTSWLILTIKTAT